jgi:hypothetical protein
MRATGSANNTKPPIHTSKLTSLASLLPSGAVANHRASSKRSLGVRSALSRARPPYPSYQRPVPGTRTE